MVEGVGVVEEVGSAWRAVDGVRMLYFDEKDAESLVEFVGHDGRFDAEEGVDVLHVLEVFIESQFAQNFSHFDVGECFWDICDSFFFDSVADHFNDMFWYLSGFFGLELGQDFFEMIEPDVCGEGDFIGRIFVGGFGVVDHVF